MIPKTIHYCWFGNNEKPKTVMQCIASWKKYCPEYTIVEWNEKNYDIEGNEYTKYCYSQKKWAYLSDYARLKVVEQCGGIYFDTDVELIQNIDFLLKYDGFFGFETSEYVASGLGFGAIAGHPMIKRMIQEYLQMNPETDGSYPLISCPILNTNALKEFGLVQDGSLQIINNTIILPVDYMNPYDDPTGIMTRTDNTVSIHWYSKSWASKKKIIQSNITRPFHRVFGKDCFRWLKKK